MRKVLLQRPLFLFLFFLASIAARAADRYVPSAAYATVQEAIDASAAGDVIHITSNYTQPAGITIEVNKAVTIEGQSGVKMLTSGTAFLFRITAQGARITNLVIEKTDDGVNQNIIQVLASDFELDNSTISAQYKMGDSEVTRALEITGNITGLNIHDNTFSALRQPAYINENVTGTIANNFTEITRGWVVLSNNNISFTGNSWGSGSNVNYYDIVFIAGSSNSYPDIVTLSNNNNNAIVENQFYSPALLSIVHVQAGAPLTGSNGSVLNPYPTISPSVPRVAEGGKVIVGGGNYAEEVNITKSLILLGNNAGVNAISGSRATESQLLPASSSTGISIRLATGKSLVVDGFAFSGKNFIAGGTGNTLSVANCKISTNAGVNENCVYLGQPFGKFTFTGNDVVMNNNCQATIQPVGEYNGTGTGNAVDITGNRFVTSVSDRGSEVRPVAVNLSSVQGTVSDNLFNGVDIGILLATNSGNITIEKNTFTDMKRTPAETGSNSFGAGVVLFQLSPSAPVNIQNNFFSASDVGVRTSAPPAVGGQAINVTNNSFTDILFFHIRNTSSQIINGTCNWHGTNDATVIASKINGLVTYVPWLTRGTDADASTPGFQPAQNSCNGSPQDNDGDGTLNAVDCQPLDPDASNAPTTYYRDQDNDGYGDAANTTTACSATAPDGYVSNSTDCNDNDAAVHEPQTYYKDGDQDGFGDAAKTTSVCSATAPAGYVANNGDCDDNDNDNYPGAPEICDGEDNDCDGLVDEGVQKTWYQDNDGDGWGNTSASVMACSAPAGYVYKKGDCNDNNNKVYPGATEICDGLDNDCDNAVDEGVGTTWYRDSDGDGYGNSGSTKKACSRPSGYVSKKGDCDDNNNKTYPGAKEICDGKDNDCDGSVDEGLTKYTYYRDEDGDGYGNASRTISSCSAPSGYVSNKTDCNDKNKTVYPGAKELCDGLDNDCDGKIDEGLTQRTYYRDADGDGWGNTKITAKACAAPAGYVSKKGDCNDGNKKVYPGAPVTDGNGIDDDCSQSTSTVEASADASLMVLEEGDGGSLLVDVYPNPSGGAFNLRIRGTAGKAVQLMVTDISGRVIEQRNNVAANSTLSIGAGYAAGVYFVQAVQDGQKVVVKCIRQ